MSPSRAPPGDGVARCRDAVEAISLAHGHKFSREKAELLQLLSLPHIQVSAIFLLLSPLNPQQFFLCQLQFLQRTFFLTFCHR